MQVEKWDKVYSIIYGVGKVIKTFKNSYYSFEVEFDYDNGTHIAYTDDGVPNWGVDAGIKTLFHMDEINIMHYNISAIKEPFDIDKIDTNTNFMLNNLEIRCPSGIWVNASKIPGVLLLDILNNKRTHLIRNNKNSEV